MHRQDQPGATWDVAVAAGGEVAEGHPVGCGGRAGPRSRCSLATKEALRLVAGRARRRRTKGCGFACGVAMRKPARVMEVLGLGCRL